MDCGKELKKRAKQAGGKRCRVCSNRHRLTDPVYKENHKKSMQLLTKDPQWLEKRLSTLKSQREDPEVSRNLREALLRLHRDPAWKERHRLILERTKKDPVYILNQKVGFRKWIKGWSKSRTTIEVTVLSALKESGVQFIDQKGFNGFFYDFYLPDQKVLIEVDGCFWHGCVTCGFVGSPTKVRNDAAKNQLAHELGMTLLRLQEHKINENPDYVRGVIQGILTKTSMTE